MIELKTPSLELLPHYVDALRRDWHPDHIRGQIATDEQLADIAQQDAQAFVARQAQATAQGLVTLPDGSQVPRIAGVQYWIWDGEFCGRIGFRWQPGTAELPPHVLGHVGYSVVPWKRRRGCAKAALAQVCPHARVQGLPHIDVTTDPDNLASQMVITANGGVLLESFTRPAAFGSTPALRFRITL
jgi:predicted acetyltransferase